jgi:PAS domain S-box-containing protein
LPAPTRAAATTPVDTHVTPFPSHPAPPGTPAASDGTGIPDFLSAEDLDRLARIAARALDTPLALLTLTCPDHPFFHRAVGLADPGNAALLEPLVRRAADGAEVVIADLRDDPDVRCAPAAAALGVVAVAGVPLRTRGGEAVGALCVLDRRPRAWDGGALETLRDVAAAAVCQLELHREAARRREAEAAVRASEERFRALMDNAPDVVDIVEADGTVRYVSPSVARVLGWTPEEIQGRNSLELLDPEQVPEVAASLAQVVATPGRGPVVTLRMRHRDGSWRVLRAQSTNLLHNPAVRGIVVNAHDVTEQVREEEALRISEERYRLLVEVVENYSIVGLDPRGRVTSWNAGAERILGYRAAEVAGRSAAGFYPPEESDALEADLRAAADAGRVEREGWRVRADGSRFRAHVVLTALRDASGTLVGFTDVTRDVTAQHHAEEALRRSEARLSGIIASAMDAIVSVDARQRVVLFNPAAERIFGHPAKRVLGQPLAMLLPERIAGAGPGGGTGPAHVSVARRADGALFPVEATVAEGEAAGERIFTVIVRDSTERVQQEEELARLVAQELEARERVTRIIESIADGFFAVDRHWRFTYVNGHAEQLWGRTRRTLLGRVMWEEFPELRDSDFGRAYAEAMRTGRDARLESVGEGTSRWYEARAYPSADGLSVYFSDVTELRRAQEALRRGEERLRLSLEAGGMGTWEMDLQTRAVVADERNRTLFGLEPEALDGTGIPFRDRIHPDDQARVDAAWEGSIADGSPFSIEFRVLHPDGSVRWLAGHGRPQVEDGRVARVSGVNQDITERRLVEEGLRTSQEWLALVVESTHDALWDWRIDTGRIYHSPRFARMLGYGPDDVPPDAAAWEALVHPDDRAAVQARRRAHFAERTPNVETEYRLRQADGGWKWVMDRGKVVEWAADGSPLRMVGAVTDVDERKRMEAALVASERDYRELFDNAHDAVLILDPEGERVLAANARACEAYGVPHDQLLGRSMLEFSTDPEAGLHHVRRTLRGGRVHEFESVQRRADGGPLFVEVRASPVVYGGRRAILSVNRDISERRQLEEQLRQAQKMEAVGRLAGGIAHDFNNVLMAISGHNKLLLRQTPPDAPGWWSLDEIRKGAERAAALTRQLLAFSRQQVLQPRVLDLNAVVTGMEGMLGRLIGEDVELVTVLDEDLGTVLADHGQLEQVLMNLAVNARDAMPDGGVLRIGTWNAELTADDAQRYAYVVPGPYVVVEVRDTGHGMTDETMAHLFEPFFTTKEPGKGTGLGLAMVYGIVKQSGGYIWVDSRLGMGAGFSIYLPRTDQPEEPAPAPAPAPAPLGGAETVLLVEDDAAIRALLRTTLASAGYTVLEAGDGEEALAVAAAHGGALDLLVTDVVMPRMRGVELARRLGEAHPRMAVLYMSGYAETFHQSGPEEPGGTFMQKPFSPDVLLERMRELLDARPGGDA